MGGFFGVTVPTLAIFVAGLYGARPRATDAEVRQSVVAIILVIALAAAFWAGRIS